MSPALRRVALWSLALLLAAAAAWWWFDSMERKWIAVPHVSAAAERNRMLAASRLLARRGYTAAARGTLAETLLAPLPAGTMIIGENGGFVTESQARQLRAWAAAGNTLVARPMWKSEGAADPDQREQEKGGPAKPGDGDPIGGYFGVRLAHQPSKYTSKSGAKVQADKPAPRLASVTLPNARYALELDLDVTRLAASRDARPPLWSDPAGEAVRVYREGKGYIVLVAGNYFDNANLNRYDHAELLLGLAGLSAGRNVVLVQRLDMLPWYQLLWNGFAPAIAGLACVLLLLLWAALRRFGPLLPEPEQERRALIEHIDAVGRWLARLPGGRELLLAAARDAAGKAVQRRAPELQRLPAGEQARRLAQVCGLAEAEVAAALHGPASRAPIEFTRQVHVLQTMRKHYER